jgi:hypothetical protein
MRRADPQEMSRWLKRRKREGWTWAQLSGWSGHPIWKLRYWQRRLDRNSRPQASRTEAFVAVEVVTAPTSVGAPIEVSTPAGYRVQVPTEFDAEHLRRVLDCLERRC